MHEVALMRDVVTTVLERAHEEQAEHVTMVALMLSRAGHITEDSARQLFAVLTVGTIAEKASLHISWLPAHYTCFICLSRFDSYRPPSSVMCPTCGAAAIPAGQRAECVIRAIEVETEAGDREKK